MLEAEDRSRVVWKTIVRALRLKDASDGSKWSASASPQRKKKNERECVLIPGFKLVHAIPTPKFTFGGQSGNLVTSLIFEKVWGNKKSTISPYHLFQYLRINYRENKSELWRSFLWVIWCKFRWRGGEIGRGPWSRAAPVSTLRWISLCIYLRRKDLNTP